MVKTHPNYESFAFSGSDNDDLRTLVDETVANTEVLYVPSGATFDNDVQQELATHLTTPKDLRGEELIIRTTAFTDDNGRHSADVFNALLAIRTGRRVIATNAPGVDSFASKTDKPYTRLTHNQEAELKHGRETRFRHTGEAVMNSITTMAEGHDLQQSYVLTASSMGVALGGGMLRSALENGHDMRGVTLAEPVNHLKRRLVPMTAQFGAQNGVAAGYLDMNPEPLKELDESMPAWLRRVIHDGSANMAYARAMAKGTFYADLGDIDGLEYVPVHLSRGAGSKLSPAPAFDGLVDHFQQSVDDVTAVTYGDVVSDPQNHPYTMTVESAIRGANHVLSRWD